jgi:hypothetical protein
MAEVYAGFLARADSHIGRLLDYLEHTNQLENTLVVVVSDNGASGEGGPNGSVNEMKFANGIPDDLEQNLAQFDELGGPRTYNHYPTGWAMAFNTPFKIWKRYEFNGGTADPCIISGLQVPKRGASFASSTTTQSTSSRRSSTSSQSMLLRRSRDTRKATLTASACATASTTRPPLPIARPSSTRCSVPGRSGTKVGKP